MRGAKSNVNKSPVHIVSAWASENNLVFGQVRVNEKSNEITAIPELLDKLMIKGTIITIDAMGTQTDIVEKIIKNESSSILAVKENPKQLLEEINDEFTFSKEIDLDSIIDIGHGRIESRKCSAISNFTFIENKDQKWKNLNQIIKPKLRIRNLLKTEKTEKQGIAGKD